MSAIQFMNSTASRFALGVVFAASLAACGGGDSVPALTALPTMSGLVVNSYVYGAVVTLDQNDNGVCESTEPKVVSSLTGAYSFPGLGLHMVCSEGGYNSDTKLPMTGQFKAPAGATAVTALSTLLVAQLPVNPTPAQVTTARANLETQLSLPAGSINLDPVANIATNPQIEQANASIQVLLQTAARSVAAFAGVPAPTAATTAADKAKYDAAVNAVYASAVKSVGDAVKAATTPINLSDPTKSTATAAFVQSAVQSTVEAVKVSVTVVATLAAAAPVAAPSITTVSAVNAASFVSSGISTLVQSVAQAPDTKEGIIAASTAANSNTTVVNVVEDVKTTAPSLFLATAPAASTQMAALAEAFLPSAQVVGNAAVVVNNASATTALTAAAAIVAPTLVVATVVNTVATQVAAPPAAPAPVNLQTVVVPVVPPLPAPIFTTGASSGGNAS